VIPTRDSLIVIVLAFVVVTNLYDLYVDASHGASKWHLFEETFVIFVSTVAIAWLALGWMKQQRELEHLKDEIRRGPDNPAPTDPKIREARHKLGKAIQEQFLQWNLTASEQEVALLLLKGLSFKEIAAIRSTLEKTVRQQASGIYRKAGVNGRHAFSAWFIEDFL
jgi:DNA-binding CsgD family transcriptional regulator